jgi:hypothetical protein
MTSCEQIQQSFITVGGTRKDWETATTVLSQHPPIKCALVQDCWPIYFVNGSNNARMGQPLPVPSAFRCAAARLTGLVPSAATARAGTTSPRRGERQNRARCRTCWHLLMTRCKGMLAHLLCSCAPGGDVPSVRLQCKQCTITAIFTLMHPQVREDTRVSKSIVGVARETEKCATNQPTDVILYNDLYLPGRLLPTTCSCKTPPACCASWVCHCATLQQICTRQAALSLVAGWVMVATGHLVDWMGQLLMSLATLSQARCCLVTQSSVPHLALMQTGAKQHHQYPGTRCSRAPTNPDRRTAERMSGPLLPLHYLLCPV